MWTCPSTSTTPQEVRGWTGPGSGNEKHYTATFRSNPLPTLQALSNFPLMSKMCLPPGSPGLPSYSEASSAAAWRLSRSHRHVSLRRLSEVFRLFRVAACVVRTWKSGPLFPLRFVSGSHAPCVWVLPVEYRLDFSGDPGMLLVRKYLVRQWIHVLHQLRRFWTNGTIFHGEVVSDPEVVFLRSLAERRSVLNRCFSFHPFRTARA